MPTSHSPEGRSPKRRKSSLSVMDSKMPTPPKSTATVATDPSAMLGLTCLGPHTEAIGIYVSSHVLSMVSPVFKALLTDAPLLANFPSSSEHDLLSGDVPFVSTLKWLPLPEDDGNILWLLCLILHFRNDKLPPRLRPDVLLALAKMAEKYECVIAIGRATLPWFDKLYTSPLVHDDITLVIQAAYLLDEPTNFHRFTQRYVLSKELDSKTFAPSQPTSANDNDAISRISAELKCSSQAALAALRADLDLLVDACTLGFPSAAEHFTDYAPGMSPDAEDDDEGPRKHTRCWVDRQAGIEFLGALREARIWPSTVWPGTLGGIVDAMKGFRVPEYDDVDKCDFCEDVKGKFELAVGIVKGLHERRLWGLCLDCFKGGGVDGGSCRIEHAKVLAL